MSWTKCKNEQRTITPKLGKTMLRFLCTAHLPNEIYVASTYKVSCWYLGQSSKCKNEQRAITPKLGKAVTVLVQCTCTPWGLSTYKVSCWYLLLLQKYILDKGWTDGQSGDYMLTLREHKKSYHKCDLILAGDTSTHLCIKFSNPSRNDKIVDPTRTSVIMNFDLAYNT
jgi:hypothetical protein